MIAEAPIYHLTHSIAAHNIIDRVIKILIRYFIVRYFRFYLADIESRWGNVIKVSGHTLMDFRVLMNPIASALFFLFKKKETSKECGKKMSLHLINVWSN